MIGAISSSSNCEIFKTRLSTTSSRGDIEVDTSTPFTLKSNSFYLDDYIANVKSNFYQYGNNNVKTSLTTAALEESFVKGNASTPVEINPSYRERRPENGDKGMSLSCIATFTSNHVVYGCIDETSTPENPVVYIETVENGQWSAYIVEINKIDLSNMTRAEGFALCHYVGSLQTDPSYGATYINMIDVFRGFIGPEGNQRAREGIDPQSFQEKISLFDVIANSYIKPNTASYPYAKQALESLYAIQGKSSSLGTVDQFLQVYGVMNHAQAAMTTDHPGIGIDVSGVKSITQELWAQGIDYTFPDGSKFSDEMTGDGNSANG